MQVVLLVNFKILKMLEIDEKHIWNFEDCADDQVQLIPSKLWWYKSEVMCQHEIYYSP